ncbi:MAG: MlaD family protein [Nitrospirae bacterium]|nr:MlaD family protein [Nitrospirota bacterium]
MKRSSNLPLSEMRVGLIVGASFLVGALVIIAYGKIINIFSRQVEIVALFRNVQGLTQGAPVRLLGIDSGYVSSVHFVRFQGKRYVRVAMRITRKRFEDLSAGATASIHTQGLMGIKYLELIPGDAREGPLNSSLPIIGVESGSLGTVMKSGQDVVTNLKSLSVSLSQLARQAQSGQGTVGRLLGDPTLYKSVNRAATDLSVLAERIDHGPGTVSKLIGSSALYDNLDRSLRDLDQFVKTASRGPGLAGNLLNDPGTAASFKDSLSRLDAILAQIQSGQGTAGSILYDPKMAGRVNGVLDRVNGLLDDMKKNPKKYFTVEVHIF